MKLNLSISLHSFIRFHSPQLRNRIKDFPFPNMFWPSNIECIISNENENENRQTHRKFYSKKNWPHESRQNTNVFKCLQQHRNLPHKLWCSIWTESSRRARSHTKWLVVLLPLWLHKQRVEWLMYLLCQCVPACRNLCTDNQLFLLYATVCECVLGFVSESRCDRTHVCILRLDDERDRRTFRVLHLQNRNRPNRTLA